VIARRYRVFVPVGILILIGLLPLAILWPNGPREHVTVGILLGTMFGHTSIASAWIALGPGHLIWRGLLSLGWVAMLLITFALNVAFRDHGDDELVPLLAVCLLGQWVVMQSPLWGLALGYGLRMSLQEERNRVLDHRARQFGIRQLMIVTAIVAIVLGIGRAVVTNMSQMSAGRETAIFAFLGAAAVIMTLPLLMAALLRRWAIPAVVVVLALVGLATYWELSLLKAFQLGGGPTVVDLMWINFVTSAWVLAFVLSARLSGYGLTVAPSRESTPSATA